MMRHALHFVLCVLFFRAHRRDKTRAHHSQPMDAVLVLGMHNSGTSLLVHMLGLLGGYVGEQADVRDTVDVCQVDAVLRRYCRRILATRLATASEKM